MKLNLIGSAAIALAVALLTMFCLPDSALADELPQSIEGEYCPTDEVDPPQRFYEHGDCGVGSPSMTMFFSPTGSESMRDVECKYTQIKKVTETTYRIQANCENSHAEPEKFTLFFDLEILERGLLFTFLSEG